MRISDLRFMISDLFRISDFGFRISGSARCNLKSKIINQKLHRSGISLMEVLISVFILSIGLLGLAALIPVGRFALVQTAKSDRAGACGRAGLRDVKVRRMLDFNYWDMQPQPGQAFAIDPLGRANGLPNMLCGLMPRLNLTWTGNRDLAEFYFKWQDDKVFNVPNDPALRTRAQYTHDNAPMDENPSNGTPAINGHYSWFCTVVPAASEAQLQAIDKTLFTVSVAVCHRRNYDMNPPNNERPAEVLVPATFVGSMPVYPGGGSLMFNGIYPVKENEWILLYAPAAGSVPMQCNWYRVVGVGVSDNPAGGNSTYLTVAGPDWYGSTAQAVIIDSVIGVYTETVELDSGLWNR